MIKRLIIGIILNAAALYGVVYLMPNEIMYTGGIVFFIIGGVVMGILNTLVKPVLKLLTLPIQILTLGLSLIVLNGIIFWLFDKVIEALVIDGISLSIPKIKTYFLAGVLFGIINWVEHMIVRHKA